MSRTQRTPTRPTPLKRAMFEQGITNRALAEEIEANADHISRIVNGLRPSPLLAELIAEAVSVDVDELWPQEAA